MTYSFVAHVNTLSLASHGAIHFLSQGRTRFTSNGGKIQPKEWQKPFVFCLKTKDVDLLQALFSYELIYIFFSLCVMMSLTNFMFL